MILAHMKQIETLLTHVIISSIFWGRMR